MCEPASGNLLLSRRKIIQIGCTITNILNSGKFEISQNQIFKFANNFENLQLRAESCNFYHVLCRSNNHSFLLAHSKLEKTQKSAHSNRQPSYRRYTPFHVVASYLSQLLFEQGCSRLEMRFLPLETHGINWCFCLITRPAIFSLILYPGPISWPNATYNFN